MEAKNHDYAGEGGKTPYRNFETAENLGFCSREVGVLIRMADKLNRLNTYCQSGSLSVDNEGWLDAIHDLINYSALLAGMIGERYGGVDGCGGPASSGAEEEGVAVG